jgi:hypothetical protein
VPTLPPAPDTVVEDKGLAQLLLERVLDQSRGQVTDAAGSESDHDMHRPIGKRVGAGKMRGDREYACPGRNL